MLLYQLAALLLTVLHDACITRPFRLRTGAARFALWFRFGRILQGPGRSHRWHDRGQRVAHAGFFYPNGATINTFDGPLLPVRTGAALLCVGSPAEIPVANLSRKFGS
uniref:Putative secreted protein n=1 Tax=Anopheles marajoara TaxID=58244 RepID=A0A2M4C8C8_9DIPT